MPVFTEYLIKEIVVPVGEAVLGDKCGFRQLMNDMLHVCQTVLHHEAAKTTADIPEVHPYQLSQLPIRPMLQRLFATRIASRPWLKQTIKLAIGEVEEEVQRSIFHYYDETLGRLVISDSIDKKALKQLCREMLLPAVRIELAQVMETD